MYIANADGSRGRPLLRDSQFDYDASFSADGQWIAFTSERTAGPMTFTGTVVFAARTLLFAGTGPASAVRAAAIDVANSGIANIRAATNRARR